MDEALGTSALMSDAHEKQCQDTCEGMDTDFRISPMEGWIHLHPGVRFGNAKGILDDGTIPINPGEPPGTDCLSVCKDDLLAEAGLGVLDRGKVFSGANLGGQAIRGQPEAIGETPVSVWPRV